MPFFFFWWLICSRLRNNQASHLLIFTRTPHSYCLINVFSHSCAASLLAQARSLRRVSEKSAPVSRTPSSSLLRFSRSHMPSLLMSSRCVLSHQACQSLTFRRCLLLDSIAKLPEPEGKTEIPSLRFISVTASSHCLANIHKKQTTKKKTIPSWWVMKHFFVCDSKFYH